MKNHLSIPFLVVLVLIMVGGGYTQTSRTYPFAQYPAGAVYKGKPAQPKLTTPTQREFRTVIRRGAWKGPNFAGHYIVVEWGCGSNCVVFAIVDAKTGRVYDRDMPSINDEYPCGLSYKLESKLFVVEKSRLMNGDCEAQLYSWDGSRFMPVHNPAP